MKLVAVMDIMAGRVVHARRGMRDAYRPLCSRLCAGHEPETVAAALARLHSFHALYLADLNAILGRGDNLAAIDRIRHAVPRLPLWVDAGVRDADGLRRLRASASVTAVIGSETLGHLQVLEEVAGDDVVLSLDFKAGVFLGPAELLARPEVWPRRVLAMNLDRVGGGDGPDLGLLAELQRQSRGREIFAAGGIRHLADLEAARQTGAAGALVASALHEGRLTAADLCEVQ